MPPAELEWTNQQARLYQLYCVGLHGRDYATGAEGVAACFADLGSVQLDPLPIMGRNHDLVIQARVAGTHPGDLLEVVHSRRLGFEYWDKMLCLIAIGDYPLFRTSMLRRWDRWTERRAEQLEAEHPGTLAEVEQAVRDHGPLSSRELGALEVAQQENRGWKSTRAANVALDALWNRGVVSVSHRENFRRYFDLAVRLIPRKHFNTKSNPRYDDAAFLRALLLRRIRGVGLLAARGNADAWTMLRAARKADMPEKLVEQGALARIRLKETGSIYYAAADADETLQAAEHVRPSSRVRFIAPLDPLMWGRDALRDLWDFDYVWEVYKPAPQRRYGYYVLPMLRGTKFIGRFDGKYDHREPGGPPLDNRGVQKAFKTFLAYLGGGQLCLPA